MRRVLFFSWGLALAACGLDVAGIARSSAEEDAGSTLDARAEAAPATDATTDTGTADGSEPGDARADAADAEAGADVTTDAGLPADFAWYPLNETSGTIAHDLTAHHYDITLPSVTWSGGAVFDGVSTAGSVTTGDLRSAPVSMTAWLTPALRADRDANQFAQVPFPPNAVSGDIPFKSGFGLGLNVWTSTTGVESALAAEGISTTLTNIGGAAFTADTRYFVAMAVGATSAQVFVNGQVVDTRTAAVPSAASPSVLWLGAHNDDTNYGSKRFFKGRMRDVRVYKRALTPAEIVRLQAAGPIP